MRGGLLMFSSDAFRYVDVYDKALDASWLRESTIANNLANIDTPGYKRKDVDFQGILEKELRKSSYPTLDQAVKHADLHSMNAHIYTDYAGYSYRLDGNNVDVDTENVELASEQIRYSALTTSLSQEFTRMKAVAK